MSKKIEANPTNAGVDEARSILESSKGQLEKMRADIDKAPHGINSDWLTMLLDSSVNDSKYFDMGRRPYAP